MQLYVIVSIFKTQSFALLGGKINILFIYIIEIYFWGVDASINTHIGE